MLSEGNYHMGIVDYIKRIMQKKILVLGIHTNLNFVNVNSTLIFKDAIILVSPYVFVFVHVLLPLIFQVKNF
jgi:hypothetical protein